MPRCFILLLVTHCMPLLAARGEQPVTTSTDRALDASYLRAHAETRGFMLGRPVRAKPTADGKAVLFLRAQARVAKLQLYEFDVATGKTRELLTPEQVLQGAEEKLSPEEKARRERMRVSVGGFTDFQLSDDGRLILVSLSGKLYVVERSTGEVRQLNTGPGTILDPKFAPDSNSVAYVRNYDVYVLDLATQEEHAVTRGGTEAVSHGLAEFVAQEEMDRFSGYWWSPDSKFIVYEEADATGVEVWHVADPARPEQPPHRSFYPRPGKANVKVRLGIVPVSGGDTVWIDWDHERYEYLASVRWEDGPETSVHGPLLVTVESRDQKEVVVLRAEPTTGETSRLIAEHDTDWVNLHPDMPRWFMVGHSTILFWASEERAGPRLEWRTSEPKQPPTQVPVPARTGYQGFVDFDPATNSVVYRASTDPTQSHLFRVSLERESPRLGDLVRLTHEPGLHTASFSRNHAIYVQSTVRSDAMPQATVHRADGALIGELPSVAEEPPFVPRAELLKVGDEPGFYCAVVRPHGFDPKRRYPVINHVYGGPGHNQVLASMGIRLLDQWLADQGFIVVSIDGRGTPGRGRDWERAIAQRFGSVPLADQVAGLRALAARFPEMDLDRVGIVGWSFGGYMSALAVLREPDIFKAAVAGAPVVDWLDYDTHYTERYLGLPRRDAAAYEEGSLLTYAAELRRPLLVVHGTADDNVYFRHTLKLADALFRAEKDFDLLPLSGLTHMVPEPLVMEQLWSRIARHFQRHLGTPTSR